MIESAHAIWGAICILLVAAGIFGNVMYHKGRRRGRWEEKMEHSMRERGIESQVKKIRL